MDDDLRKWLQRLGDIHNFDEVCDICRKPRLLHIGPCLKSEAVGSEDLVKL